MTTKVTHKHIYGQPWTREEVIKAMRQRVRQKLPVSFREVFRDDSRLCGAVLRKLGSWTAMYKILGIKPENMRTWPLRKVIRSLREAYHQKDVNRCQYCWKLARRFIPSRALIRKKFNLPAPPKRLPTIWPREKVIKCLQERMRDKKLINTTAILADNRFLYAAARHRFGSYKKAVQAAGFDYDSIKGKGGRPFPGTALQRRLCDKASPEERDRRQGVQTSGTDH